MRRLFTLILCLTSAVASAQCYFGYLDFDVTDSCYKRQIIIDTVHYHNNRWQVGAPHKAVLDSPYSAPNVIMTDTLNPYPSNDTSIFILKIPGQIPDTTGSWIAQIHRVSFRYRLDIDSNAHASVEFSRDGGLHWLNLSDTLPTPSGWIGDAPRFDMSTNYWLEFDLSGVYSYTIGDTLLLRFAFMSGSTFTGRDGWMIDNIRMWYWTESVPTLHPNSNLITLYPNPSHGNIYVHTDKPHRDATITITDMQGRQVYSIAAPANGYLNLQLPNGVYTLKYSDEEEYCVKQVVIQN